jgi:hypothetical protein
VVIQDIVREEERPDIRSGAFDDQAAKAAEDDM